MMTKAELMAKELEDALRQIQEKNGSENNEWDAVERVIPEIMAIVSKALGETK